MGRPEIKYWSEVSSTEGVVLTQLYKLHVHDANVWGITNIGDIDINAIQEMRQENYVSMGYCVVIDPLCTLMNRQKF